MRTLSGLMIAAGLIGTIAATGATPTLAQGVYLTFRDRDSESISADLRTGSATTTGATPIMTARACTRKGDITEVPRCTSVVRTDGVIATGINET